MMRTMAVAAALGTFLLFAGSGAAADKAAKNQMVKGTIKSVDIGKSVLIVNQKVGTEFVERQLSITPDVEFSLTTGSDKKAVFGKDGLALLAGQEGASVQVKCDKDVNVLKVTVTSKK